MAAPLPPINFEDAIAWTIRDARDDFFPDALRLRDLERQSESYLALIEYKRHQFSRHMLEFIPVPKSPLLRRDAIVAPIPFRLVYTGVFRQLFGEIAPFLEKSVYSYRQYQGIDSGPSHYPFPSKATSAAWLSFVDDFRSALLADRSSWAVVTDLANFFERIRVDDLVASITELLPRDRRTQLASFIDLLGQCLHWTSRNGVGIPQNYDASSFFGSAYLTPIDRAMGRLPEVSYFRWMDDIRIVAKSRGAVIDATHQLQDRCRELGLHLNSAKTSLVEPGSPKWTELASADFDKALSELSIELGSRTEPRIRATIPHFKRFLETAGARQDDRFVRAFGNRLLDAASFRQVRDEALSSLRAIGLSRLRTHPERADTWAKFLVPDVSSIVQDEVVAILRDSGFNRNPWTNMHLVSILAHSSYPLTSGAMDVLKELINTTPASVVRYWSIIALGRHTDDVQRKQLASMFLTADRPPILRRAAIIAIQELFAATRDPFYKQASRNDPETTTLVAHLTSLEKPRYDSLDLRLQDCTVEPHESTPPNTLGIGLVDGQPTHFPRRSRINPSISD